MKWCVLVVDGKNMKLGENYAVEEFVWGKKCGTEL